MPDIKIKKAKTRGKRYEVTLENGEKVKLASEVVFRHGVFVDHEFTAGQWEDILHESAEEESFNAVMGMLNRRMHTELEVKRKLYKKQFSKQIIESAIARAHSLELLNDAYFAKLFVEEKIELAGYGRRRIQSELMKRGVDRQIIEEAIETYSDQDGGEKEYDALKVLAERKIAQVKRREEDPYKVKQKVLAYLAGRGFTADMCYRALDELL